MRSIDETMSVFGGMERTAYRPNEVKKLLELRDMEHQDKSQKLEAVIGVLLVACYFLGFCVAMLW